LARELVKTFRARNCGIALLNREKTELTVVADALAEGHEEHAVGIVIPMEGNLSSQYVVDTKRSLVIVDAQTDPMTAPIHDRMRQRQTKCLAIIPLLSAGDVIGTIGLDTTDPVHVFSDEEIRLAETMANQMANAIEKQRLFDQTKARARREQVTREIGANMTRSLDMETILQTMARELSHALGASHAVVRIGAQEHVKQDGNGSASKN
jgi:GAF domain-containing protein